MRKTFNVTEKDYDILPHLNKQVNMSRYIISLVKEDMGRMKIITEDQIISIVKRYISKVEINTIDKPKKKLEDSFPMDSIMKILE